MTVLTDSTDNLSDTIRSLGAALKGKFDEVVPKVRDLFGESVWIGSNPPDPPTHYVAWLYFTSNDTDLRINYGTASNPSWISPIRMSRIPSDYGVQYRTSERIGNKDVWACRFWLGALPNNATKTLTIPWQITSVWGPPQERCIDTNNSYVYQTNGNILPLPHVSGYTPEFGGNRDGFTDSIILELANNIIRISTESNRTNWFGIVTVKYTRSDA